MDSAFDDEVQDAPTVDENPEELEEKKLKIDLLLGPDDGEECTYSKGYMKRQVFYTCLTCTPDGNAGVCFACALSCHDGHEIVDVWTKRNLRCDCGNSKFGVFFCKLFANKDVENALNSYNHNFKGLFCTCRGPFDYEEEAMIQCCVCEDWLHEDHIGLDSSDEIPRDEEDEPLYEDFICKGCSASCSFLNLYGQTIIEAGSQKAASVDKGKDKEVSRDMSLSCGSEHLSGGEGSLTGENSGKNVGLNQCTTDDANANANAHVTCALGVNLLVASPGSECDAKPMFLSENWRDALCRCGTCCEFYKQKHLMFLLDKEDTVVEYEDMAMRRREEKQRKEEEGPEFPFLDKFGHVEKMEFLYAVETAKDEVRSFVDSFDRSRVITAADVEEFRENMAKKYRLRY